MKSTAADHRHTRHISVKAVRKTFGTGQVDVFSDGSRSRSTRTIVIHPEPRPVIDEQTYHVRCHRCICFPMRTLALSTWIRGRGLDCVSQTCKHIRKLHCSPVFHQSPLHDVREQSANDTLVLHSTTRNPYLNLALEHYLLTKSHSASRILLFYTNRPCVVIGRNQNPWSECNLSLLKDGLKGQQVDLVRRRSGGGTVFHDEGNLNFSAIVPNDHDFARRTHAEMVVRAIKAMDVVPNLSRLFSDIWVNERHDIVIQSEGKVFKVSGSAFKLTRGRALHHGTILHSSPNLADISRYLRSPSAAHIQAKGVESVRSPVSNLFSMAGGERTALQKAIAQFVTKEFAGLYGDVVEHLVSEEDIVKLPLQEGLEELQTDSWKFGQTPRFSFTSPVFGQQQFSMVVNHGVVEEASIGKIKGLKLAEIEDWTITKEAPLNELLQKTFPFLSGDSLSRYDLDNTVFIQEQQTIKRKQDDGSIEVEIEGNTVEAR